MSFTEIRFPENISYGSTGGPEFSTDVRPTANQAIKKGKEDDKNQD